MPDEVTYVTTQPKVSWMPITLAPEVHAGDPPWTARDHFAGLAMQAIIAKFPAETLTHTGFPDKGSLDTARGAYVYADAMLAVRKAVKP